MSEPLSAEHLHQLYRRIHELRQQLRTTHRHLKEANRGAERNAWIAFDLARELHELRKGLPTENPEPRKEGDANDHRRSLPSDIADASGPTPQASGKYVIPKEWFAKMSEKEEGLEIGAGTDPQASGKLPIETLAEDQVDPPPGFQEAVEAALKEETHASGNAATSEKDAEIARLLEGVQSQKRDANEWFAKWELNQTEKVNLRLERDRLAAELREAREQLQKTDLGFGALAPKGTWLSEVMENIWRAESAEKAKEIGQQTSTQIKKNGLWIGPRELENERDALKTKLAESVKASFWEGYESYWRHHQLQFPITASEIAEAWESSTARASEEPSNTLEKVRADAWEKGYRDGAISCNGQFPMTADDIELCIEHERGEALALLGGKPTEP